MHKLNLKVKVLNKIFDPSLVNYWYLLIKGEWNKFHLVQIWTSIQFIFEYNLSITESKFLKH